MITFVLEKTNVRQIESSLQVSISVISPQSACYFASGCRISSKSDHMMRKYDVMSIFQHGSPGRSILFPVTNFFIRLHASYSEGLSKSISKRNFVDKSQFIAKREPCRTPLNTSFQPENTQFITTLCCLSSNHFSIHSSSLPSILCAANLSINLSCGTLSNAEI